MAAMSRHEENATTKYIANHVGMHPLTASHWKLPQTKGFQTENTAGTEQSSSPSPLPRAGSQRDFLALPSLSLIHPFTALRIHIPR